MPEPRIIAKRYALRESLDEGGMGQVWRAYDLLLGRDVAVKLILDDLAAHHDAAAFVERFQREVRVTAQLHHSGIPQVYDAFLDGTADRMFMVMELVQGVSLKRVIDVSGSVPSVWAVCLALHVCAALHHAHEVHVIHRDIKPANIMITVDGAVKVLDFGIAMALGADAPTRLTKPQQIIGSPHYMAPEQFDAGHITPQTDLYALGVVLHELLAGERLFDGGNIVNLMCAHVLQPPAPVRRTRGDVDPRLERLILDLLAKRAYERPNSARHVIDELLGHLPHQHPGYLSFPDLPTLTVPPVPIPGGPLRLPAVTSTADPQQRHMPVGAVGRADRLAVAQALFEAGKLSSALSAYEALVAELGLPGTQAADDAQTCRIQAARCRIGLGQHQRALDDLQRELALLSRHRAPTDTVVLEVRLYVGLLLRDVHRFAEAARELGSLYKDLVGRNGPDPALVGQVREALIGIRRRPPGGHSL
ncbi:protein kinase [Streptomyces sp. NPDC002795]|uniref:protein kinase domain-containing protein n=1 Tax=Streptomyces sp. NPDC002795 TaxID=3364665 RepID=UPI0036CD80A5